MKATRPHVSVITLVTAAVLDVTTAPARAQQQGPAPCDALTTYLREALAGPAPVVVELADLNDFRQERYLEDNLSSTSPEMPAAYIARVTPACREETRRGAAPAAAEAARAWTQQPQRGWVDRGRIILCTMQDPASLGEVGAWMADPDHPGARAACASALATWPGAEPVRGPIFARALRKHQQNFPRYVDWDFDPAVVAAANIMGTPELREQLVSVLGNGYLRHAANYNRLRAAVCIDDGSLSANRAHACATLPSDGPKQWSRSELWTLRVVLPLSYAGFVTIAYVDRNDRNGRDFPTAAGVVGGSLVGGVVAGSVALVADHVARRGRPSIHGDEVLTGACLGGSIAGGVLGGIAAHGASPGARAPVTAIGFAPLYVPIIAGTFM